MVIILGGVLLYIPKADKGYPKDLSVAEYKENVGKNADLIIATYEKIDAPTLRECDETYPEEAKKIHFHPTYLTVKEEAGKIFIKRDKLAICQKWRLRRFLHKHYPNTYEAEKQYKDAADKLVENGGDGNDVNAAVGGKTYTYKDGSIISFGPGAMSVQYADENPPVSPPPTQQEQIKE